MLRLGVTQVVFLLTFLHLTASLPVWDRDTDEAVSVFRRLKAPWALDVVLHSGLREMTSSHLDRRRQLGDIEFSNRYADFLRSKAKHTSICAFLHRMQAIKKSVVGGDVEKVNVLLKQNMCPSVYSWTSDL